MNSESRKSFCMQDKSVSNLLVKQIIAVDLAELK